MERNRSVQIAFFCFSYNFLFIYFHFLKLPWTFVYHSGFSYLKHAPLKHRWFFTEHSCTIVAKASVSTSLRRNQISIAVENVDPLALIKSHVPGSTMRHSNAVKQKLTIGFNVSFTFISLKDSRTELSFSPSSPEGGALSA